MWIREADVIKSALTQQVIGNTPNKLLVTLLTLQYGWLLLQFSTRARRCASQKHHSHLFFNYINRLQLSILRCRLFSEEFPLFCAEVQNEYIHHSQTNERKRQKINFFSKKFIFFIKINFKKKIADSPHKKLKMQQNVWTTYADYWKFN